MNDEEQQTDATEPETDEEETSETSESSDGDDSADGETHQSDDESDDNEDDNEDDDESDDDEDRSSASSLGREDIGEAQMPSDYHRAVAERPVEVNLPETPDLSEDADSE